jgi:thymidylate kinase
MKSQIVNPVKEVESMFLGKLFQEFEKKCITYAVARDIESLPESLEGRDLDIVVKQEDIENTYHVIKMIAQLFSADVLRIDQEFAVWLWVINLNPLWVIRLDIGPPDCNTWRGYCYLNLKPALEHRVYKKNVYRLNSDDIIFMQFCRDVMGRFALRHRYRDPISKLYHADPEEFWTDLAGMFGRRCATKLTAVCQEGKFESLKPLGKLMRREVIIRGLLRNPIKTIKDVARYFTWRSREYLKPNGIMVALLGPDGSGKGTLIMEAQTTITHLLHNQIRTFHWRPKFLPTLGSLLLGRKDSDAPVDNPHAKKPSGLFISILRLAYYTADYVLGYWLVIRPYLGRKAMAVIFDRYFYDYFTDSIRFRVSLPDWIINLFSIFVHEPDLIIVLSADPHITNQRKPELPAEEINRQIVRMKEIAKRFKNVEYIDTSGEIEESKQLVIHAIVKAVLKHMAT